MVEKYRFGEEKYIKQINIWDWQKITALIKKAALILLQNPAMQSSKSIYATQH